ncbi:TPA: DNA methyltransferase [Vibrio parahaemolyticus]|uniref:DNA methyltransferase n=1 Tax=Vibrio parahaemolyticus TaxID=670 RepID=UPI0012582DBB|nr:DNA methyltransferase [Vibrio parahaemolyticus]VVH20929.1 DNA methyl transferase [Vibrio phage vB_VpaM_VP-3212]
MSRTTGNVIEREMYPTPDEVVDALLKHLEIRPSDKFLEPCKGTGSIYGKIKLPEEQKYFAEISEGIDYLETNFEKMDIIITNPPFSLSEEFIKKSLSELADDGTMIYLQRVNFLGAIKRIGFWQEVGMPNKLPVIIPRPKFIRGKTGDSCEYAWFVWDRGHRLNLNDGLSSIVSASAYQRLKSDEVVL